MSTCAGERVHAALRPNLLASWNDHLSAFCGFIEKTGEGGGGAGVKSRLTFVRMLRSGFLGYEAEAAKADFKSSCVKESELGLQRRGL